MIFALDLEGVLAPELWPILGQHFDLPELALTTREVGDFLALMRRRVEVTRNHGLKLHEMQQVTAGVEPYLGAREFLSRLRTMGQIVIISDTFHELSEPLIQKLGGHCLFANRFELEADGRLRGFELRIRGMKERIVSGFQSAGFAVAAMGDSLNDRSLLRSANYRVLYRPVDALRADFPDAPVAVNLDDALDFMVEATKREAIREKPMD
jgi:phosphoserine/homoserine phosphotransferase